MLVWRVGRCEYRLGPHYQRIITMRTCTTIAQHHPTPDGKPGAWVMLAGPDVNLVEQHSNARRMLGSPHDEYCEIRVQDDDQAALIYKFLSPAQEAAKAKRLADDVKRINAIHDKDRGIAAKSAGKPPAPSVATPALPNPVLTTEPATAGPVKIRTRNQTRQSSGATAVP